jgi:ribonucleoside-diphosphate reductase beta chain
MKLYNQNVKIDVKSGKLFDLRGERNLQRYDEFSSSCKGYFYKAGQLMDSQFWKPAEVSLTKDNLDFKNLEPHEERIFTLNLKRQEILDSLQGRGPQLTLGRVTTLPEFEYWCTRVTFQESNHSDTYAYILKNVYSDASKVFDEILDDEMITRHSKKIAEKYEDLYKKINEYEYKLENGENIESLIRPLEKAIYLALIGWNILEGVRFYVSFACTFAFAENKKMEGNAKELKLIARDENVHLAGTQFAINKLRKESSEGYMDIVQECEEEAIQMYKDAAEDEIEWAEYLFKEGSIIGLNSEILKAYMKYLTNNRMRTVGLPKIFDIVNNPLPWINPWLGIGKTEVRAQETQLTDYKIANTSGEFKEEDWG